MSPMKTLACFAVTWITAAALLLWLGDHNSRVFFAGGEIEVSQHVRTSARLWHALWVSGVYSAVNTFIVRFWQMQVEWKEKKLPSA